MAKDPVIFSLANPVPEIIPEEALEAGARIVATGRSDFPNQVNNRLALIIHDRFYCNRGYAAATGGLAAQSVNGLQ